ncbi:hypothetical protein O3P69_014785 [Scylla paramamosain]|uniref:Uncharacterized protein n=1 Tax=Scylla paramamosain TaxID=85552 RepID=A0AAW0TY53_SCYPA
MGDSGGVGGTAVTTPPPTPLHHHHHHHPSITTTTTTTTPHTTTTTTSLGPAGVGGLCCGEWGVQAAPLHLTPITWPSPHPPLHHHRHSWLI